MTTILMALLLGASQSVSPVLQQLHVADQGEVQMGKLAQRNGGPAVQEYGRMLVTDHTEHDQKVQQLAQKKGVDLNNLTDKDALHDQKESRETYQELLRKSGKDFDNAFARAMVEDHNKDIKHARAAASSADDNDLRALLNETIPTLEKHDQQAVSLTHE
jgi:putative membrane protein